MSPGGRLDVLYRCLYEGVHTVTSSRSNINDDPQLPKMTPKVYQGRDLFRIEVIGGSTAAPSPAPTLEPTKAPPTPSTSQPLSTSPTLEPTTSNMATTTRTPTRTPTLET